MFDTCDLESRLQTSHETSLMQLADVRFRPLKAVMLRPSYLKLIQYAGHGL